MLISLFLFGVILFAIAVLSIELEGRNVIADRNDIEGYNAKKPADHFPSDIDFYRALPRNFC